MQSDEVIWQVINQHFCSYKVKYVYTFYTYQKGSGSLISSNYLEHLDRTFVVTNITSPVFAIVSRVHLPTVAMQLSESTTVHIIFFISLTTFSVHSKTHIVALGILYLYMKTPERAHSPAKMWEKVKLSKNYAQALAQVCFYTTQHKRCKDWNVYICIYRSTKSCYTGPTFCNTSANSVLPKSHNILCA